ncbi:MAG: UMP kinase, partial [Oscillospiraceae bacterium]|nr:UMP kinase [Oscillospiraceae bacterium]
MKSVYKRVLLKLSGEVLAGGKTDGVDFPTLDAISAIIKRCVELEAQTAVIIGGGNFWRGRSAPPDMERSKADDVGMLATMMNSLIMGDALRRAGAPYKVMSALDMPKIAEIYNRDRAVGYLEAGYAVIIGCGTGNPFFSTDSAAALRAAELSCDVFFKSTNVDGVYDKNPHDHADAAIYKTVSYSELLSKNLGVMDAAAAAICREFSIQTRVFNLTDPENIIRALKG